MSDEPISADSPREPQRKKRFRWSGAVEPIAYMLAGLAFGALVTTFFEFTMVDRSVAQFLATIALTTVAVVFGLAIGLRGNTRSMIRRLADSAQQHSLDDVLNMLSRDEKRREEGMAATSETAKQLFNLLANVFSSARLLGFAIAMLGIYISAATLIASYLQVDKLESQNGLLKKQEPLLEEQVNQIVIQNGHIERQTSEMAASRSANAAARALDAAVDELTNERGKLSEESQRRIAISSRMLRPYRLIREDGSLSKTPRSPERGALLEFLYLYGAPGESDIWRDGTFAAAELATSQLQGLRALEIDLTGADMHMAKLDWVELQAALLPGANLSSASLRNAGLYGVDARHARINQGDLSGANLRTADLRGADLTGSNLEGASLCNTKLEGTLMPQATALAGARFSGPSFDGALVPSATWLDDLRRMAVGPETALPDMALEPLDDKFRVEWKGKSAPLCCDAKIASESLVELDAQLFQNLWPDDSDWRIQSDFLRRIINDPLFLRREADYALGSNGVKISRVLEGGLLETLGLESGDTITQIAGMKVNAEARIWELRTRPFGGMIPIRFLRNGAPRVIKIYPAARVPVEVAESTQVFRPAAREFDAALDCDAP